MSEIIEGTQDLGMEQQSDAKLINYYKKLTSAFLDWEKSLDDPSRLS